MYKYEYIESGMLSDVIKQLNEYGRAGWRLVGEVKTFDSCVGLMFYCVMEVQC